MPCAVTSIPPHFVVNAMSTIVLSVLTTCLWGQDCLLDTTHVTRIVEVEFTAVVLCCVLCAL